jgi:MscS family membrane protein
MNGWLYELLAAGTERGLMKILLLEYHGNAVWRFLAVLLVLLLGWGAGRLVRFLIGRTGTRLLRLEGFTPLGLFLQCLARPAAVAVFAVGVYAAHFSLVFAWRPGEPGFSRDVYDFWRLVIRIMFSLAFAYLLYRLVDIVEYYLKQRWADRSETAMDKMLAPLIRRTLRVIIAVVAVFFIADNFPALQLRSLLAAAGVGGLAIALAAQDTIGNFFGSVTIFADQPFQVGEYIKVGPHEGAVEHVGFRSTRLRTVEGSLVTVPNSTISKEMVVNVTRRPHIRRVVNLTLTYGTPPDKVARAVALILELLARIPEVNTDPALKPRAYFNDFKDWSLNIMVIYWVQPADYWLSQEVGERFNLALMRVFAAERIEFAFPSQTIYLEKSGAS